MTPIPSSDVTRTSWRDGAAKSIEGREGSPTASPHLLRCWIDSGRVEGKGGGIQFNRRNRDDFEKTPLSLITPLQLILGGVLWPTR